MVEGVSGRGSRQPSRVGGASGLGVPDPRGDPPAPGRDGGVRAAAGALPRSANR
jgi:hypothetical protein